MMLGTRMLFTASSSFCSILAMSGPSRRIDVLQFLVGGQIARAGDDAVEVFADGANVLGDAPLVVIENDDQAFGRVLDVIERLVGNAVGQRRVAHDADNVLLAARFVAARGHAEGSRQRRPSVSGAETIVGTFRTEREPHGAAALTDLRECLATSRDELMNVDLMAHVPDKRILRAIEHAVHRQRQLDHAEVRAQVTAVLAQHLDEFIADLLSQRPKLVHCEQLHIRRRVNHVEITSHGSNPHLRG